MEDSSCIWPVSVQTASFQESISLFKEEVILYQFLSLCVAERCECVVLASQFSLKASKCLNYLLLNFLSLCLVKSRTKRVPVQISSNSESCTLDKLGIVSWKRRSVELAKVHVTYVFSILAMSMIILNDLIKQRSKRLVGVVGASVNSDS